MNPVIDTMQNGEYIPGAVLDGLRIEKKIGAGAMANLYLARGPDDVLRVLKIARHCLGVDPVSLVAFENELRLAPYLRDFPYAHMPKAWGETNQYLIMDYIPGADLWTYLKAHGPLSEAQAVALAKKLAHALRALHRLDIIHLDLKLSNVMLTPDGEVRLVDFGLANHRGLPDLIHESFHEPKGTPAYIAPEQFNGVRDEPRSDIFSFGAMLFELTTGKLPYPETNSVLGVSRRIGKDARSPRCYQPALSKAFEKIVLTCLGPSPDDRFDSMDALYAALAVCGAGSDGIVSAATAPAAKPFFSTLAQSLRNSLVRTFASGDKTNHARIARWVEWQRGRSEQPFRILVTLVVDDDAKSQALNLDIIQEAYRLSTLRPSRLTFMTALAVDTGAASGERETKIVNDLTLKARVQIVALLRKNGHTSATGGINVMVGNPVDAIQQCVEHYGIDLVVIGCRTRRGFTGFIHGRTGYKILTSINRSIYVVHADSVLRQESVPQLSAVAHA
jgi:serine/threonine protein kinase